AIGFHQQWIVGEMRQQPQLNLRVIGREQHVPWLGNESGTNFAPEFGANGNVLQVRIRGGKPAGCGSGRIESSVYATGARVDLVSHCCSGATDMVASAEVSIFTPADSIRARTGARGRSMVS